jgi:surface carbohydrate biosynthesis protein
MSRISVSPTQRADVAVLKRNLELWPVFREVLSGFSVLELETIKTPLNVRDSFRIAKHVIADKASIGYASMAAQLQRSEVKVLLAVDQTSQVVEELGRLLPELRQVVIAHGSIRADSLKGHLIKRRNHRVLCAWGQADADAYGSVIDEPVDVRAIGSLRNAHHLRQQTLNLDRSARYPLLFISQYSGKEEESSTDDSKRVQILRTLKSHVHKYCQERGCPLLVALRPPVSAPHTPSQRSDEVRHYEGLFSGVQLSFTDSMRAYSSYVASDESDVTIGVPSGALTESFARGNKVLMFRQDPATGGYYGFPLEGPWLLTEPTYEEFAERLDALRSTQREKWAAEWQSEREYMVANAESDRPITMVREMLERAIRGESL